MRWFVTVLVAVALTACGTNPNKKDGSVVEQPAVEAPKPGTAAWSAGALKLPVDSPMVLTGQIERIGRGAVQLKEWLVADPAMFGEDGEQLVEQLELYWSFVVATLGGEMNSDQVWKRHGIDPERAAHLGLYPLGEDAMKFLGAADASIRTSFGLSATEPIGDSLAAVAAGGRDAIPKGFNSALKSDVEQLRPLTGARLVVPVAEKLAFSAFFLRIMDALEFKEETTESTDVRVFSDGGEFPAVRLEVDGAHALIDIVVTPVDVSTLTDKERNPNAVVAAAEAAAKAYEVGRPAAPAPLDDPALALSFYQPSMAAFARLRGYQRALTKSRTLAASDRDLSVFVDVLRTERLADNWHTSASGFEGLIYGLEIAPPDSNRIAAVTMTMVSDAQREALPVRSPSFGLGVENRSMGVSLDFGPLFESTWQSWLGIPNARERLDLVAEGEHDPLFFLLTIPRNFAYIGANLSGGDASTVQPGLREFLISELPNVSRAEVAVIAPDLSGLTSAPKFAALFAYDSQKKAGANAITARASRDFIVTSVAGLTGTEIDVNVLPELPVGWGKIELDGMPVIHTDWQPDQEPRLLVVVGLDEPAAQAELVRLTEESPDVRDEVIFFFARPSAFVDVLSGDDMDALEPIDAPILAQRLGPVLGWVKPRRSSDASAIHFKFELQRPPRL